MYPPTLALLLVAAVVVVNADYACNNGVKACGSKVNTVTCDGGNGKCVACADGKTVPPLSSFSWLLISASLSFGAFAYVHGCVGE